MISFSFPGYGVLKLAIISVFTSSPGKYKPKLIKTVIWIIDLFNSKIKYLFFYGLPSGQTIGAIIT